MNIGVFIAYYIVEILQVLVSLMGFSILAKKKLTLNSKNILQILIISLILLFNNILNKAYFITIIALILLLVLNKLIFKLDTKQTIKNSLVLFFILLVVELLISLLLFTNFKNIENLNNDYVIKIIISLIECISLTILFNVKYVIKLISKFNYNYSYIIIINLVILLNIFMILRLDNPNNLSIISLTGMCIIIMLISINIMINDKYNIKILKEKNKNIKDSYEAYYKTIEECRIFKHNLKNTMYALKTKLPEKNQKEFDDLLQKQMKEFEWINNISVIPEGLQGLIYLKIKEAKNKKINIILNSENHINIKNKDYFYLCETIGILIDNAIEASIKSNSHTVVIDIDENEKRLKIDIINIFNNKIDLNKISKKNYSTKEIKSGIGLYYISKINNNNIDVKYKIINNLFISKIIYK